LTPKKQKFARVYFKTGNGSEAYRQSYDCAKMKPETINKRASELLADRDIAGMLEQLREQADTRVVLTKERALEILAEIANGGQDKDRVAALKQAGKMNGWEAPTRQQIEHALASPFEKFMDAAEPKPEGAPDAEDMP
jgi:phage terminase small subunit